MSFQKNAIAAKLASPMIAGTNAGSVDHMTSFLTETLLTTTTVECGRHSDPYSAQTSTEGLVCDRGDESGV